MKNLYKIIAASLIMCMFVIGSAQAQPKLDGTDGAGNIITTITTAFKNLQRKVEESSMMKTFNKWGKGAKAWMGKAKKARNRVQAEAEAAKKIKDGLEKNYAEIKQGIDEQTAKAEEKTKAIKEIRALEDEKKIVDATHTENIVTEQARIQGQIDLLDNNTKMYRDLIAKEPARKDEFEKIITENNNEKTALNESLASYVAEQEKQKDNRNKAIDKEIKALMLVTGEMIADSAGKLIDGLFSSKKLKAKKANQETADKAYLKEGEKQNISNTEKIKSARKKEAIEKTLASTSNILAINANIPYQEDLADEFKDDVIQQDGANDAVSLEGQLKVEQMLALINILRAQVQEMKAVVAQEQALTTQYSKQDYTTDQGVINLCNYKYDPAKYRKKAEEN